MADAKIVIPRLSEQLEPLAWPHVCQRCGRDTPRERLLVWQEHDDADRPELVYVVLCNPCSARVIDPHPRLYRELAPNEPAPGVMRICGHCEHQQLGRCCSPLLRRNGGPGLKLPDPDSSMHVSYSTGRGRKGGFIRTWNKETLECPGFELRGARECP